MSSHDKISYSYITITFESSWLVFFAVVLRSFRFRATGMDRSRDDRADEFDSLSAPGCTFRRVCWRFRSRAFRLRNLLRTRRFCDAGGSSIVVVDVDCVFGCCWCGRARNGCGADGGWVAITVAGRMMLVWSLTAADGRKPLERSVRSDERSACNWWRLRGQDVCIRRRLDLMYLVVSTEESSSMVITLASVVAAGIAAMVALTGGGVGIRLNCCCCCCCTSPTTPTGAAVGINGALSVASVSVR